MILGVKQLTPTAEKMRRLMHYGQMLQSHALHFFHLSSPDLLFGFGSDVTARNIVGVVAAHPEVAKKGVLLRKYGQEVIRMTAGKRVHGTGSVPGGVNKSLTRPRSAPRCSRMPTRWWPGAAKQVAIIRGLFEQNLTEYNAFGRFRSNRHVPGASRRRHGPLPRRPARARHRRQAPVRPFRLRATGMSSTKASSPGPT
jgi:NAD-reducing hydrogenase large subunit